MLKKLTILSALLASTAGVAMANPAPYVGAGLGVTANTSTNSSAYLTSAFRGAPLSVLAGYGGAVNDWYYAAAEVNASLLTGSLSGTGMLKSSYGYGISVLPGYMLNDHTVAFLRAGLVRTHFSNLDKYSTGGQLGLGLQTSVTQHLDVRGEYDFTAYSAVNTAAKTGGWINSIAPRSDTTTLSLVYKFD